jgi:hypothetical protein
MRRPKGATHEQGQDVEVVTMTKGEWHDAAQRALAKLGLTYEQLAEQAKARNFSSLEARKLWVSIGGT